MKITVVGAGPGGLYFALLLKKHQPEHDITVYERNRADDTFGFGVVFSDETLEEFLHRDPPSYERIRDDFAYWDDIVISFKGQRIRCGGNGFCGSSRQFLLNILQSRCLEEGVKLQFEADVDTLEPFADSDIIVGADGINSWVRESLKEYFEPEVDLRHNKFTWLGSTAPLRDFHYFFESTEHGIFTAHTYEYQPGMGTWVLETTEEAWRSAGLDRMVDETGEIDAQGLRLIEGIFADALQGHSLLTNRSVWRNFPAIRCKHWSHKNVVLLGDAKATAHWSIGSGTKLAMESAIALADSVSESTSVTMAFQAYDDKRREQVSITQHAADVSLIWFEHVDRYWSMKPMQFAFGVMSRSKQITYDNLKIRDSAFVRNVDREFAQSLYETQGFDYREQPVPPMFTRFRLRDMVVENRVVVSPMAQYSANQGVPGDWHFVHLTSRALGGAGLVYTEMTCTSPDARITPGCTGLYNSEQRDAWARIVDFVHTNTPARICMQIGHAGRKGSTQLGWEQMDYPLAEGNWPVYSASPLPYRESINQVPRELSRDDMERIKANFVRSVEYAEQAGFDMIEAHMAHGYLLASFISPVTNQRSDVYGGDVDNRMRYPLEVFAAMRAAWPPGKPMSVRISASDWYPGGLSEQDLLAIARMFKDAGADVIDCSSGQTLAEEAPVYGRMFQVPFADHVRNEVGIPTMAVANISAPEQVNMILAAGRADLVALARTHLSDPYFTQRAAAHYGVELDHWPAQYLSGRDQLYRLAERQREQDQEVRRKLKPKTHAKNTVESGRAASCASALSIRHLSTPWGTMPSGRSCTSRRLPLGAISIAQWISATARPQWKSSESARHMPAPDTDAVSALPWCSTTGLSSSFTCWH